MRSIFRHITLIFVAAVFIISSTGVYLTIHYCSLENTTGLFFFTPLTEEPCEHHANDIHAGHCCGNSGLEVKCSMSPDIPVCCSNTVLYIAVEDHFVKTDQPAIPISYTLPQSVFGFDMIDTSNDKYNHPGTSIKNSPPLLYGKELAFFNRILLL